MKNNIRESMFGVKPNSYVSVIVINNADEKHTRDKKFVLIQFQTKIAKDFSFNA